MLSITTKTSSAIRSLIINGLPNYEFDLYNLLYHFQPGDSPGGGDLIGKVPLELVVLGLVAAGFHLTAQLLGRQSDEGSR